MGNFSSKANEQEHEVENEHGDDNDEILNKLSGFPEVLPAIKGRLSIGRERYGHGVIVSDDTTQFGTKNDDWLEMAHEEFYDGIVYLVAEEIRRQRNNKKKGKRKKALRHIREARNRLIQTVIMLEKYKSR